MVYGCEKLLNVLRVKRELAVGEGERLRGEVLAQMACGGEGFEGLVGEVFAFQMRENVVYRRYVEALGKVGVRDWREIPALPTDAFKWLGGGLRCFGEGEVVKIFRTSGTTGEVRGEHWLADVSLYEASLLCGWRELGLPGFGNAWFVSASPEEMPDSSLVHMFDTFRRAEGLGGERWLLRGDVVDWGRLGEEAGRGEAMQVFATALALWHGMEAGVRVELPPGSWILETGGYKGVSIALGVAEFRGRVAECFGVDESRILNEYGMTELSSPFYAWNGEVGHRGCSWVRVRVVDPESGRECEAGEVGYLEILDLANVESVVAIRTQDLGVAMGENGFRLLGRDVGALPRGCSRVIDEKLRR